MLGRGIRLRGGLTKGLSAVAGPLGPSVPEPEMSLRQRGRTKVKVPMSWSRSALWEVQVDGGSTVFTPSVSHWGRI